MWQSLIGHACTIPNTEGNVVTLSCLPILLGNVIFWLLVLAGITALFFIILSGFKFVTSGGDPKQAEGARKTLTFAVIGLILILTSFAIVRIISQVTGVRTDCLTRFGFTQCVEQFQNNRFTNQQSDNDRENDDRENDESIKKKACTTYGAGVSECGGNKYCNVDLKCVNLPELNSNFDYCNTKSQQIGGGSEGEFIPSGECSTYNTNGSIDRAGFCLPKDNPNIPNCSVFGTCICNYDN